ncbi:serine/threonine-protein kinase 11-interacting protein isoform X2 [Drosophila sulfurigaster albostrigata]|uniref:serine/threonine-protein kinase 11-interacting protein isoform X2 n=1 Tax=Drosophila sulfurigaster albostrigata TaxID=89887 RepID=UPI002D219861|nr:serine/threonine-protein kinase 11-interacting protein isoform X2 [Drosophila sulfurigaster albostrigata]
MDPQIITELANLLRKNGDKILSSEFTLTLSGPLLRGLNDAFALFPDSDIVFGAGLGTSQQNSQAFQVLMPYNAQSSVYADLQLLHDFVQKTTLLKLNYFPSEHYYQGAIDICKFRALRRLEVHKINISQVVGIQALRSQLQHLICIKSLNSVEDIITHCGGDKSNGFVWNELQTADFSYNNLRGIDTALEFAQHLQHLNLRHNKLISVSAIKWLPHLKTLDLSYNCLTQLPLFHAEACKRLQSLNISSNYVEELLDMTKLDALTNMDLSDNCLLEHSQLLPLSVLMTLTTLNLQGNPLACHPKHRLATAQYLHKNTSTVKFVLDFEPLSKPEKAMTGSQQLRNVGMGHRIASSYMSINSSRGSVNTPASSIGSQRSISMRGRDSSSEAEQLAPQETQIVKRRTKKLRSVEIAEHGEEFAKEATAITDPINVSAVPEQEAPDGSHLETKKKIETLRMKYGNEWLQSGNTELMLGINAIQPSEPKRHAARQELDEFLGELSANYQPEPRAQLESDELNISSTPTNGAHWSSPLNDTLTPIKLDVDNTDKDETQATVYESCDNTTETEYQSMDNTLQEEKDEQREPEIDKHREVLNLYGLSSAEQEEEPVSDEEPDEKLYIVCHAHKTSEPLFLTISSNYIREKDALNERTKTKWSLRMLESCERIKSNTLRINFDTMQKHKQERVYSVDNALCQEIEKKLRDILSQRDLTEMNITPYICLNCGLQFSRERNKKNYKTAELRCPNCAKDLVAEVHDETGSMEKTKEAAMEPKLSPALIVDESPVGTPLMLQSKEDNQMGNKRLFAINTPNKRRSLMQTIKRSANSLNESSSCSKITNSQCSFDSNRSVVGSSNTERDLEFRANESDVDIISNPSQSSIEVLDPNFVQSASRKTSEERRIAQIPNLQTIDDDHSQAQSFIEREFGQLLAARSKSTANEESIETTVEDTTPKSKTLAQVQLTESSSSGSVTDSICTTYEQQSKQQLQPQDKGQLLATNDPIVIHNLLHAERNVSTHQHHHNNNNIEVAGVSENGHLKKGEEAGLSSVFGGELNTFFDHSCFFNIILSILQLFFQSTNVLMSSSKKLIESESTASGVQPYKFNYSDFNDIDHRLKLYFYQRKFKDAAEHFKWLAKGRIFNEQTQTVRDGLLIISTSKCYLMEAYAPPHDDVSKWLRQVTSATINRLTRVQCLPWKLGLSFTLNNWGNFALLLQDMLRTDSLLLYLADNPLPSNCELIQDPSDAVLQRLNALVTEPLKMCTVLSGCRWTCGQDKRNFEICTLLTSDTQLHVVGNGRFNWLTTNVEQKPQLELSLTQQMSNLVEAERVTDCEYKINFLDETENQCELWHLQFETQANAECCLDVIGKSWEQLFGVPFSYSGM